MTILLPTLALLAVAVGCEKQAAAETWEDATAAAVEAQARADYGEARRHLDRATALAAEFSKDDLRRVRTVHNVASVAHLSGNYAVAEQGYREALELLGARGAPLERARSLKNLAVLLRATGRSRLALGPLREAIALAGEHQLPGRAAMYHDLGELLRNAGETEAAREAIAAGLAAEEAEPDPRIRPLLHQVEGLLLVDAQRWTESEPVLRKARRDAVEAYGHDHPVAAAVANNLGQVLLRSGQMEEAGLLLSSSLATWESRLGPSHPNVAMGLNNLGQFYRRSGDRGRAEPLYRRALEIWEAALGPNHPDVAKALKNLGDLFAEQRKFRGAEALYRRAGRILDAAVPGGHPIREETRRALANVYRAQGRVTEARMLVAP